MVEVSAGAVVGAVVEGEAVVSVDAVSDPHPATSKALLRSSAKTTQQRERDEGEMGAPPRG